jgi:4-amino-4-deoxy-L-arabinose transferase-like glycosyltransferase
LIEREWREASDLRTSRFALAAVLIAAAVLRFWGLARGIPYAVQVDEPEIVERAVNMMRSGSLHPHFFDYPGLYLYVQFAVACVRFMAGAMTGEWASLGAAPGGSFYLWGRAVTAACGVITVLLVYQIGARWGARHALVAAGLMAVLPLHVRYSHYVLTDTPLTFFVTLTLLLSLAAHERGTLRGFAWAGAAAGLSAATKYNGGIALVMPLLACWMTPGVRPGRLQAALAAVVACGAAFLLFAPYTVLALPEFLNNFARLAREYQVADLTEPAWVLYLKLLVRHAFGWPALLLAAGGVVLGIVRLVRGPGRVRWALVVTFPLVYFWMLIGYRIVYARYLLPLTPALCVLAATAVVSGVSLLRRYEIPRIARTSLIAALTTAALLPPIVLSVRSDRDLTRVGTVDLAYAWIVQNLPPDSSVVVETRAMRLPQQYRSRNVSMLRPKDYQQWRDEGVEYMVASSDAYGKYFDEKAGGPQRFPREYAEYMRIFVQSRELAKFSPSDDHPGPEVRILKVVP